MARGQYVELAREGEGAIWTVLGEFADLTHNTMPEPDRAVNNTDIWVPDFSRDYFMDLLFDDAPGANSMRNFYIEQSSNRYTVHGDVTDWVPVPGDAATYDDDLTSPLGGNAVWYFLKDSVNGWYDAQIAAGKTPAEINAYLSQFDVWDRYDYNGNGNFDEPDGYIDTFQSVHAGVGNEACSRYVRDWAIWSHSWYAFSSLHRHGRPRLQQVRRHPDRRQRLLGRQVHDPARERRRRRLHPRVRPRSRACRTCTTPPAARTAPASGR